MIHVSTEFKERMKERTDFRCFAELTLGDGRELTLGPGDFAMGGQAVTDGAGAAGLPLGAAVCRTVELRLANPGGKLDGYDFFGAKVRLYLTFPLAETEERIELGMFTVTEPARQGETVTVTAADDMYRTDRAYATALSYPATLGAMFRELCDGCGIPYATAEFVNSDFAVMEAPGEGYTCRQVLGYIAMLAGGNARVHRDGRMEILSYDPAKEPEHELGDWITLTPDTDDVTVTGLEATDSEGQTVQEGSEGYVLTIENPLVIGQEAAALAAMGARLIGLRVRRFEGEYIAYPLAECMDTARITDRKGNAFTTVLTDVRFTFGGRTALSDSAASPVRGGSRYATPETRARQAARELVAAERTARQAAVAALNERLSKASGMYGTRQVQPDGSSVWYLHDKPTLEESSAVMKLTGDAIGFSTDGGKSYPFGFTVTGEMIMGIIRSDGISADWVKVGGEGLGAVLEGFVGRDENDQVVSMLNASADQINIKGNRFVLDSDNFKVAADGTVEMTGANVKGTVNASAFTLQGAGLSMEATQFVYSEYDGLAESGTGNVAYGNMLKFDADQGIYLDSLYGSTLYAKYIYTDFSVSARTLLAARVNGYEISENGTPLAKKYLSLSGGTLSGDLWVANGSAGLAYVPDNGGRLILIPPPGSGIRDWNIDGYEGVLRFFAARTDGTFFFPVYMSEAATSVNNTLVVGGKVELRTDGEGGNIRVTSPDASLYAEMDLYNNKIFRIYLQDSAGVHQQLGLAPDPANSYIHGTADKVAHPLTFTGAKTGSYDGSAATALNVFGYVRLLTAADDLNNIKDMGVYSCGTASMPKNSPFTNAFTMLVLPGTGSENAVIQCCTRFGAAGHTAFRGLSGGAWVAWTEAALKTDVPDTLTDLTDGTWKNGDSVTMENITLSTHITSSNGLLQFCIPIGKPISAGSVKVTKLTGLLRGVSGYLDSNSAEVNLLSSAYTLEVGMLKPVGMVRIFVRKPSGWTNATNNTPVSFYGDVTLTFAAASDEPLPGPEIFDDGPVEEQGPSIEEADTPEDTMTPESDVLPEEVETV